MSQSLAQIFVHLVFSTKHREPLILPDKQIALNAYLLGILNQLECGALQAGGTNDHVHMLFLQSKKLSLVDIIEEVKKSSSKWMKTQGVRKFYWQTGYGAFSVSASNRDAVIRYIATQEEHHRGMDFKTEYRGLLDKHKMEYDERYVWD